MNEFERRWRVYRVTFDNDLLDDPTLRQALFEFGVEIVDPQALMERVREEETNSESE